MTAYGPPALRLTVRYSGGALKGLGISMSSLSNHSRTRSGMWPLG